jgi:exo-beta-1,3-glucanase (GH17 family)
MGVANTHERDSGVQALRDIESWGRAGDGISGTRSTPVERRITPAVDYSSEYGQYDPYQAQPPTRAPMNTGYSADQGYVMSGANGPRSNQQEVQRGGPSNFPSEENVRYHDDPFSNRYSISHSHLPPGMAPINPNEIEDDGDDGLQPPPGHPKRRSFLGLGGQPSSNGANNGGSAPAAGAIAGAAGAGGILGAFSRDPSGNYSAVPGGSGPGNGNGGFGNTNMGAPSQERIPEKSEWLNQQTHSNKRMKWIIGSIIVVLLIGAIVGGVVGGILASKNKSSSSSNVGGGGGGGGQSAKEDDGKGDLDANSDEIKALLNNKNLHKVLPGVDYTPINAQYPDCLSYPPSQNNITRDVAVLSQLTNAIRLYGTDCNQTEMLLHSIDKLNLKGTMKVWLGVYLDSNTTTNDRQIAQMWDILDKYKADPFKGVIVGNEVLFRKDLTLDVLASKLSDIKSNLTAKYPNLPLATADLGDNWTPQLAEDVDIVMANIHPFFAGVTADAAASWTYDFWQDHDVSVTKGMTGKTHVISEVGWPSGGGNKCMPNACTSDTQGSVAGIDEMNIFMASWICQSLGNGTEFFW